jgi:hypothetical protein
MCLGLGRVGLGPAWAARVAAERPVARRWLAGTAGAGERGKDTARDAHDITSWPAGRRRWMERGTSGRLRATRRRTAAL